MSKPLVLVTGPVKTRSGYGNHTRDICRALIELDKYDVKVNSVRWGSTPLNALEDGNEHHEKIKAHILDNPSLPSQPDLHLHIVIPNEFQPIAKKNIGMTAGMETSIPLPQWVDATNKMDETIFTSKFSEASFKSAEFDVQEKPGVVVKMNKPSSVLFEGVDTDTYKPINKFSDEVNEVFKDVDEDFGFLFVGHWLQGGLGQDRKDVGMLIKVFIETFKNIKNPPALFLKTSGADFSILDREDILKKIEHIKKGVKGVLPNIYLIHGDFTDEQMNELYNYPKVKAHITFTHGEGFGRPLLEASQSGKPVIAPGWSGHVDFLNQNYAVLLPGTLNTAPKEAFPKDMIIDTPENKWITVNYSVASNIMKDIHKNYQKYLVKAKQLQIYTKQKFSFEAMKGILEKKIDSVLETLPKSVELKLPKLNKVDENKIKLPKLKKA
tara:strand:+ start:213 stop:1526 length:1314 start_codon:yes stop_codon:yes gene_type:complete